MAEIVERFEKKARFDDETEAELIREKLEQFMTNILAEVESARQAISEHCYFERKCLRRNESFPAR